MKQKIENLAMSVLNKMDIKKAPIPIEEIIGKEGLNIKPYDFGEDVSGVLYLENGVGTIGYNPSHSHVRQRFTLAHELGHFLLHSKKEGIYVDKKFQVHFRNHQSSTGEIKKEQEANAFAAAILMPKDLLLEEVKNHHIDFSDEQSLKDLAKAFGVSMSAITYRLANLNIL